MVPSVVAACRILVVLQEQKCNNLNLPQIRFGHQIKEYVYIANGPHPKWYSFKLRHQNDLYLKKQTVECWIAK